MDVSTLGWYAERIADPGTFEMVGEATSKMGDDESLGHHPLQLKGTRDREDRCRTTSGIDGNIYAGYIAHTLYIYIYVYTRAYDFAILPINFV